MKKLTIIIILNCLTLSCNQTTDSKEETINSDPIKILNADPKDPTFFTDTISYELLCTPLGSINSLFKDVEDFVLEGEDFTWPGKKVNHSDGTWTQFKTSVVDTINISSVTTTSKDIRFNTPYHVGDKVGQIQSDGNNFIFNEGEGGEYFYFFTDSKNHLGFRVEEEYSSLFYKNVYKKGLEDPMIYLNPDASIIEITIASIAVNKN